MQKVECLFRAKMTAYRLFIRSNNKIHTGNTVRTSIVFFSPHLPTFVAYGQKSGRHNRSWPGGNTPPTVYQELLERTSSSLPPCSDGHHILLSYTPAP